MLLVPKKNEFIRVTGYKINIKHGRVGVTAHWQVARLSSIREDLTFNLHHHIQELLFHVVPALRIRGFCINRLCVPYSYTYDRYFGEEHMQAFTLPSLPKQRRSTTIYTALTLY